VRNASSVIMADITHYQCSLSSDHNFFYNLTVIFDRFFPDHNLTELLKIYIIIKFRPKSKLIILTSKSSTAGNRIPLTGFKFASSENELMHTKILTGIIDLGRINRG
jgi:hypothetical protein